MGNVISLAPLAVSSFVVTGLCYALGIPVTANMYLDMISGAMVAETEKDKQWITFYRGEPVSYTFDVLACIHRIVSGFGYGQLGYALVTSAGYSVPYQLALSMGTFGHIAYVKYCTDCERRRLKSLFDIKQSTMG